MYTDKLKTVEIMYVTHQKPISIHVNNYIVRSYTATLLCLPLPLNYIINGLKVVS